VLFRSRHQRHQPGRGSKRTSQLGQQALDWYKQVYADEAPDRAAASQRAGAVSDAMLRSMNTQTDLANDYSNYNKTTFRPLEQRIVSDAQNYDTLDRRDQAAGRAAGDIELAAASARAAGSRELERMGVNPSDGAYGSMERSADTTLALGKADAMNRAREQVRTTGHAMEMDAASLGRGLPSAQATSAGLALNAGQGAVNSAQVPLQIASQGAGMVGQGYNTAINGMQASGNLYGQVANLQEKSQGDFLSGIAGLGMAAGKMGFTPFSDKRMKKDRKRFDTSKAVDVVAKMPVDSWKYKDGSPGADGGQTHVGPMAQDVHAAAGEAAAPGGNKIDLITMNGITLAAVQGLTKNVKRLEKKVNAMARTEKGEPDEEAGEGAPDNEAAEAAPSLAMARKGRQPVEA
jgi:hypothetical protein